MYESTCPVYERAQLSRAYSRTCAQASTAAVL
eukprot:SAG25_NODE_7835_length_455_cov_1.002809_1_plen_31_part_01